jgi:hypothetical protein
MRRLILSVACGIIITFLLLSGIALFMSYEAIASIFAVLLYWPSSVLPKLWSGLDCANADLIKDKLTCAGICLIIDVFAYSCLVYAILISHGRRKHLP